MTAVVNKFDHAPGEKLIGVTVRLFDSNIMSKIRFDGVSISHPASQYHIRRLGVW